MHNDDVVRLDRGGVSDEVADPALRALVEQRDGLERQIAELKLRKDGTEAAAYEQELEKLLTELALAVGFDKTTPKEAGKQYADQLSAAVKRG